MDLTRLKKLAGILDEGVSESRLIQWAANREVKVLNGSGLCKEMKGKTLGMHDLFLDKVGATCYLPVKDRTNLKKLNVGEVGKFTGVSGDWVEVKRVL